jgi:hypothetical protein
MARPASLQNPPDLLQRSHGAASRRRREGLGIDNSNLPHWVVFIDDPHHPACVTGVLAVTAPGGRVVRLCTTEIKRARRQDSPQIVAAFIHEMLHTLGLAENPPSSNEITKRVLARCR